MRKAVLITGASGGIGEAIAIKFAQEGYDVIATYNKNQISDKLQCVCDEFGAKLTKSHLDIADEGQVKETFANAFKSADYLDCIVCNAGISIGEKMLCDCSNEDIAKLINVNLVGTIYCNREAVKHFLKQKHGNIVNISSIYGVNGGSCESVYSSTKGGIIALTKALSQELSDVGIRVNAIAPGYVETKMTAGFSAEEKEAIRIKNGLERLAQPEDVAKRVYDVANSSLNGEVLFID